MTNNDTDNHGLEDGGEDGEDGTSIMGNTILSMNNDECQNPNHKHQMTNKFQNTISNNQKS